LDVLRGALRRRAGRRAAAWGGPGRAHARLGPAARGRLRTVCGRRWS